MDVGDGSCLRIETKGEPNVGRLWWGSDAARPQPAKSIALFCCLAALQHEGEKVCFLVCRDLFLRNVADSSCAVVKAIAFYVPPRAHFHFPVPGRPVMGEMLAKSLLP